MANPIEWIAGDVTGTEIISGVTLSAGANLLSSEIDNSVNLDRWADFELQIDFDSTPPIANNVIEMYILTACDGTNYEDGDATPIDPAKAPVGLFAVRAVLTAQRQVLTGVLLPPTKFKILLKSEVDQSSSTDSTTLKMWSYNENIV